MTKQPQAFEPPPPAPPHLTETESKLLEQVQRQAAARKNKLQPLHRRLKSMPFLLW